jgi:hypothetical protein
MALGMLALLAALWAGLVRLGWGWPPLRPAPAAAHGPLMIGAFLGTVIGVERAVALSRRWTYLAPLLAALGGLALILGLPGPIGPLLTTLGSLGLVAVFGLILRIHTAAYTVTMAVGTLLWLAGNILWLAGGPIYSAVYWWAGFLILTIAGERLELNRVLRLAGKVQTLFVAAVGLFLAGLLTSLMAFDVGVRLAGAGMVALALWLLRYDIASYTVRKTGLTRYIAVCLLAGFGWLALSGLLGLIYGEVGAGFQYDAILHALFVGFVMSMIFGHAPIIFPTVIGRPIPFRPSFYLPLALLHLSLLLRISGDLTFWLPGRQWGGLLNVVAILLFLAGLALAMVRGGGSSPAHGRS